MTPPDGARRALRAVPEKKNLLALPAGARPDGEELFETLLRGGGIRLERIISRGQTSPEGFWYDQAGDEWVLVLDGEAEIARADGSVIRLSRGDSLFLPKGMRHRVVYTSDPCLWLALHGNFAGAARAAFRIPVSRRLCRKWPRPWPGDGSPHSGHPPRPRKALPRS
ncbi:MAG: cupin domain-containing protein [Desulfovibrio sp.]|nr:cupin domain-containing protein [Desulfovibrio sp.]